MSFFGIMGVGLAMNLLGGIFRPKPPAINNTYFTSLQKTLADNSKTMQKTWESKPGSRTFSFDFKTPDYPEKSATKFVMMQQENEGQRESFMTKFTQNRETMKEEFFAKNHYETQQDSKGRLKVLMQNGKPVLAKGRENPTQQNARLGYEATTKAEMFTRHNSENRSFVQENKQQLLTFLDSNKFQLANPGIQGELSKIIMDTKKKALKLQDNHEEEFYKIDLPVKEMHDKVDSQLAEYREMRQKHLEQEENSPEARELATYQQDLVALLDAKREEAREKKKSEMFLKDPSQWMQAKPDKDPASVLPMNLVAALEEFEINELPA
ncbi:MAG: hypothetical protein ACLFQV_06585 [Vulcanimicrobiota bacterium]